MRTTTRLIASTVLGALLVLSVGVGSTLAKGSHGVERHDLDDAWCFQDVVERYCFEQDGTLTIETRKDGTVISKVDMVLRTKVTAGGKFVARSTVKTRQVSRTDPDGSYSFTSHERTKWTDGKQTCDTDSRLKIVDFDVIVDTTETSCR